MGENKIRIILSIMLLMILVMLGCDQRTVDEISLSKDKTSPKEHEEIVMTTPQSFYPLTSENMTVTIQNNTSDMVYTGYDYSIEHYDGTSWNELPLEIIIFLSSNINIEPKNSRDFIIYLYPEQYNYQPGRYRVCKAVSTSRRKDDPGGKTYNLTAEFKLE